jgi:hypothetical protein
MGGVVAALSVTGDLTRRAVGPRPPAPCALFRSRFMGDGEGRVRMLVRVSGSRPDGRAFDTPQVTVFALDGGRVRSVDQFVGDPAAVAAFWA